MQSGLGRDLYNAATILPDEVLTCYLATWCDQLQYELMHDPHHLLGHQYEQLANQVPHRFPQLSVVKQYIMPITSGSLSWELQDTFALWTPCCPNLGHMAELCQTLFMWGDEAIIWSKFQKIVWPGAILRSLLEVCGASYLSYPVY